MPLTSIHLHSPRRPSIYFFILLLAGLGASTQAMPKKLAAPKPGQVPQAAPSPMLAAMSAELDRTMPVLGRATPPAYFISYTLTQSRRAEVMGSNGALLNSAENVTRWLEVQMRVGDYTTDNTHKVGNGAPAYQPSPGHPGPHRR